MIVVDASVMLDVLMRTPDGVQIGPRLLDAQVTLHAPELIDLEVAQVLRRLARQGEIGAKRGREALQDLSDFEVERYPNRPFLSRIWQLRDNLSAYDAAYVALAEALRAPLVTRGRRIAEAPHAARVEVI